jgi:hypothetical protein
MHGRKPGSREPPSIREPLLTVRREVRRASAAEKLLAGGCPNVDEPGVPGPPPISCRCGKALRDWWRRVGGRPRAAWMLGGGGRWADGSLGARCLISHQAAELRLEHAGIIVLQTMLMYNFTQEREGEISEGGLH